MKGLLAITALTSAISCGSAIAQDEAPRRNRNAALELTMTLMPTSAKTSTAVTAIIELPKELSGNDTRNTHGVDTANRARDDGRGFGKDSAAAARDNREAAGRASHGVGNQSPPALPEPPGRPNLPSQ